MSKPDYVPLPAPCRPIPTGMKSPTTKSSKTRFPQRTVTPDNMKREIYGITLFQTEVSTSNKKEQSPTPTQKENTRRI
ncbi:hypothetical protein WAI453_004270 [Rhynchosporium graminicola]